MTISRNSEFEFKEKGSRFLGKAYPVLSKEEAEEILVNNRKKYYDASHICFAYKMSDDDIKYSDDGEPNGTAGIRLLNAINHFELSYIIVLSIRYFGGTKLGVGPLGKAYYLSGLKTLEQAKFITKELYQKIKIIFEFEDSGKIHNILHEFKAIDIKQDFLNKPILYCSLKINYVDDLKQKVHELTNGKAEIKIINKPIFI